MSTSRSGRILAYLLLPVSLAAGAARAQQVADPKPGSYIAERGWGSMDVVRKPDGSLHYAIESLGANGHSCTVEGNIHKGRSTPDDPVPGSDCKVSFKPAADGVEVVLDVPGSCREYCGARASFDARYLFPAPGCSDSQRKATQAAFSRLYRAKDYAAALALLQPELQTCAATLYWVENAQISNDVAVTLHHLGRDRECLAVLKPVVNGYSTTEEDLRGDLPPADFENFLPQAKAAWYNIKLCGGKPEALAGAK